MIEMHSQSLAKQLLRPVHRHRLGPTAKRLVQTMTHSPRKKMEQWAGTSLCFAAHQKNTPLF
jgi:hypothetical protein